MKKGGKWNEILVLAGIVLLFRIFYVEIYNYLKSDYQYNFADLLRTIFREYPFTLLMVLVGFFTMRYISKRYSWGENPVRRTVITVASLLTISVVSTALFCVPKLKFFTWQELLDSGHIEAILAVSVMANAVVMGVTDITLYYRKSHKIALEAEITKKNKARFQYDQLKRQLNPHFLFNSLNVLDYLIHTDANRASDFTKKLAGVYRYLLSKENDPVVTLEEEITFANMYVDLLKERFNKGLNVRIDVGDSYLRHKIIPCSLQLLIENATKHNIISSEMPLNIEISICNGAVCIENNLQPRINAADSMGLGLKSIRGQYETIFGREIEVSESESKFRVCLPVVADEDEKNELS